MGYFYYTCPGTDTRECGAELKRDNTTDNCVIRSAPYQGDSANTRPSTDPWDEYYEDYKKEHGLGDKTLEELLEMLDPVEDAEFISEAKEALAKEQGKNHRPLMGCPKGCKEKHIIDEFMVHVSTPLGPAPMFPLSGIHSAVVEGLTSPQVPPTNKAAKYHWTLEVTPALPVGKKVTFYASGDAEISTGGMAQETLLFYGWEEGTDFDDVEGFEVVVSCTFNFGGEGDEGNDFVSTTTIAVGGFERTKEEATASHESKFVFEELAKSRWADLWSEGVDARAWVVYDFEIGKADLSGPNKGNFDDVLRTLYTKRIRNDEFMRSGGDPDSKTTDGKALLRRFYVTGYGDRIDKNGSNGYLALERKDLAVSTLNGIDTTSEGALLHEYDLTSEERQKINQIGEYPFGNDTPEGRAKNRSVILWEVLHIEGLDEKRRRRLKHHLSTHSDRTKALIRNWMNSDLLASCFVKRTAQKTSGSDALDTFFLNLGDVALQYWGDESKRLNSHLAGYSGGMGAYAKRESYLMGNFVNAICQTGSPDSIPNKRFRHFKRTLTAEMIRRLAEIPTDAEEDAGVGGGLEKAFPSKLDSLVEDVSYGARRVAHWYSLEGLMGATGGTDHKGLKLLGCYVRMRNESGEHIYSCIKMTETDFKGDTTQINCCLGGKHHTDYE